MDRGNAEMDSIVHLDAKGLIVQADGDGGDTLQREGFWYEGAFLNPIYPTIPGMLDYNSALSILTTSNGFTRYWQTPYNDPSDTSRDQLVSNIRAWGYYGYKGDLEYIFNQAIKNWSRFPNGDIVFINDYARFIRAFRAWWLYPLLPLFDVPLVINSIIRCIKGALNYDDVGDDINHIGDLAQAQHTYATPVSWLARKIYKCFRARGGQYALDWYFRSEAGGNPEFALLWASIVAEF